MVEGLCWKNCGRGGRVETLTVDNKVIFCLFCQGKFKADGSRFP